MEEKDYVTPSRLQDCVQVIKNGKDMQCEWKEVLAYSCSKRHQQLTDFKNSFIAQSAENLS